MTDNIQSAGSVEWQELFLTLASGVSIDLRPFVKDIKIYENLFHATLMAELAVSDATGMIGSLGINGTQTVTVKLKSPFLEDSEAIHKTFGIAAISDRNVASDRQEFFIINLVSLEGLKDISTRFSKRFVGSTDEMAETIYNDFIAEPRYRDEEGRFGDITPLLMLGKPHKTNNFAFTATNWTAIKCMDFLAKNSEPADYGGKSVMPNAMFFERRTGFVFGSITELIHIQKQAKQLYDEYNYIPSADVSFMSDEKRLSVGDYSYTSPFISKKYNTVSSANMKSYFNEMLNQQSGYYGSVTIGVDMLNRLNYHMVFDYTDTLSDKEYRNKIQKSYDDFIHLADERPTSSKPIFSPFAKQEVKIATSNLFADSDFGYNIGHYERTTFRNSAFTELKRLKMKITVPGKTDVQVGNLIRFNYPKVGNKLPGMSYEDIFDQKISGLYVITGIVHKISQESHDMVLEIARDSFGEGG